MKELHLFVLLVDLVTALLARSDGTNVPFLDWLVSLRVRDVISLCCKSALTLGSSSGPCVTVRADDFVGYPVVAASVFFNGHFVALVYFC